MTEKEIRKRIRTMDVILIIIAVAVTLFTACMIWLFYRFQAVPDALIVSFYGLCGIECGAMAAIKNKKEDLEKRLEEVRHAGGVNIHSGHPGDLSDRSDPDCESY